MHVQLVEVDHNTAAFHELVSVAEQLGQAKYIAAPMHHANESLLLGAFADDACVGFLRLLIAIIGSDAGRPPIVQAGRTLTESFVEAFGVLPAWRRHGIGQALQEHAIALCRQRGCYQIRSRSPITSRENYALKLKMGYAIHPSHENDSYYIIKVLAPFGDNQQSVDAIYGVPTQ